MGSLYSYCDMITKLVYPPELSRIAGFCINSIKTFLWEDPRPAFNHNCLRLYYNRDTANHLEKKLKTHTQSISLRQNNATQYKGKYNKHS